MVAVRLGATLDETEGLRRGNSASALLSAGGGGWRCFRDHPEAVAETARLAERLRFDLTRELGYSYPGAEDRGADRRLAELCRVRLVHRYRGDPPSRRGRAAAGGGAGADQEAAALRLLPAPPGHAGAGPRGGGGGAWPGLGQAAAAARTGPRLERQLAGLLPDRPLPHRPGQERALPGALPERGAHRGPRHRPRLPARHPREADPAGARALRAGALGAGRLLRHLPGARGDSRPRQGARAAARRGRAVRARRGRLRGEPRCLDADGGGARRAAGPLAPLAGAGGAAAGDRGAAPPHLPAPRRHGDLDHAADRALPGAAGGDGGTADRPVGQGLVRGRRLPEDRPARAGDALGGGALRRRDRAHAR